MAKHENGIGVEVKNNDVEKALKVFNRRVGKSKRLLHWKLNQYYTKPSEEKRREEEVGESRVRKAMAEKQPWKREKHLNIE